MLSRPASHAPEWIACASVLVFVALGAEDLRWPALQYDEVLFVNASLGGITDSFIHARAFGIPVMLMPYIGALKAYLFAPVFALFAVSLITIRLPAIALSAVSVFLGYKLGRLATGSRWVGAALSALMATDPIFVFMSRADYGPIVLMVLLKLTALVAMYKLLHTSQARFAWMLTVSMLLGLFDKLNFAWIVVAFLAAAAVVYGVELARLARKRQPTLWAAGVALLIGVAVVVVLLFVPLFSTRADTIASNWRARADSVATLYRVTMNAQAVNSVMLGKDAMPSSPASWSLAMTLGGGLLLLMLSVARPDRQPQSAARRRSLVFFLVMFAGILLQLAITPEATGPHHAMTLWPFNHVLLLLVGAAVVDQLGLWLVRGPRARAIVAASCGVVVLAIAAAQLRVTRAYDREFATAKRSPAIWSRAIYPLVDHVSRSRDVDAVFCVDWGACNQVFALSPEVRGKTRDLWPVFQELSHYGNGQAVFDQFFRGKETVVIARAGQAKIMNRADDNFKSFAAQYLGDPAPATIITDDDGAPVFEVYEVRLTHSPIHPINQ